MAAAFERARTALDGKRPLSKTVEKVLQRCGSRADLLLDTLVNCCLLEHVEPLSLFKNAQKLVECMNTKVVLPGRPLLAALQEGDSSCPYCSPLGRLLIQSVSPSGSSVEGFMPRVLRGGKYTTSSDVDFMLQLGPVQWEVCGSSQETASGSGASRGPTDADSGQQADDAVPRLRVVPTDYPGFVLLYQVKEEQCAHQDEYMFSGDSVRRLIKLFFQVKHRGEVTGSGPATSYTGDAPIDGLDMVPCLRANWWPSEEFFRRRRARDWPPAAVRDDIRQYGIHLVPVGAKGSSTELHEFRLSFSRPELVAAWHLLPPQRMSLITLKLCKSALGQEGKPVKSYYMKTALFWLCQDSDVKHWTSVQQGMHMIIDYLERAVVARYLGCFFWSEINLFRQSSSSDLEAMRHTLGMLRGSMTQLMTHELSSYIELYVAPIILQEPCQEFSERELRVCLVRYLVSQAVIVKLKAATSQLEPIEAFMIMMYIRAAATAELALVIHDYQQQNLMFLALTVAPDDVMTQCRLTAIGSNMFSWDAAPLIGLLTRGDLRELLGDPDAVDAWLKSRRRLPSGIGSPRALADLLLNPPLLAEALRESVPSLWTAMQQANMKRQERWRPLPKESFDDARRTELEMWNHRATLGVFESLPHRGTQSALYQYKQSREKARQFLDDPRTRAEFDQLRRRLPDPWRLRQFVFTLHSQ